MKKVSIGLEEALGITLGRISPLGVETIPIAESTGRIATSDLNARVNVPSMDSSLKDGYAVISREVDEATPEKPVRLTLAGHLAAGGMAGTGIQPGTTFRVLTGAPLPEGADAVVSEEFTRPDGNGIIFMNFAEPGRNILPRGRDIESGTCIIKKGERVTPGLIGLVAAAGHSTIPIFRNPVVAILGTGDEVVLPGEPLTDGKLYASNIVTISAWCRRYWMDTRMAVVRDDPDILASTVKKISAGADAIITSGGAWTGDRDLMAAVLEGLGWRQYFHRIRIGPGKAVGFGMLDGKPVFILPGGPSSNLMGFLQIGLPGLLALAGHADPGLTRVNARLGGDLKGRDRDWTDFIFGRIEGAGGVPVFHQIKSGSRLRVIAEAGAIAAVPEGAEFLPEGSVVSVQLLK